ncbi:MAG: hypothetical protein E2O56_02480 [Gammaproteobacteria bacterium]|nr:MAG: hypothetical protein E2O56_02480 [Gammaproteobacteria bacterium]
MRKLVQGVTLLLAAAVLPGCGGGGGSDGGIAAPPTPQQITITITAVSSQIPANTFGIQPFLGSPFIAQIIIDVRNPGGSPVANGTLVNVSVAPVSVGAFSTLDDPDTDDVNEFFLLLGQGSVPTVSGQALIFFHSFDQTGTSTISVSATDPNTGNDVQNTIVIQVINAANTGLPSQLNFIVGTAPQYVQGSGGQDNRVFQVQILDAGGLPVDPAEFLSGVTPSTFNNLRLRITGASKLDGGSFKGAGPTLLGIDANGVAQDDETIFLGTTQGIATATIRSGSDPGTFTVEATADRADNNVDNGIQDPVSDTRGFTISDGQLFALTITVPDTNSIEINRVFPEIEFEGDIPPDPDGTYSLTVSVIATDRGGNPPVSATEISFGVVDAPVIGFPELGSGFFGMSGFDGNPVEGGTGFFAPGGDFVSKGIGAGPGDSLVLFGKDVPGNSDHESQRIVSAVTGPTTLTVTQNFNLNDVTGVGVDDGAVIPYVVGRAQVGNISTPAVTNTEGVATTQLTYPVSRLGQATVVWAQGSGGLAKGQGKDKGQGRDKGLVQKTVADAEILLYPGVAPATFAVFAERIPANTTIDILMCLVDALGAPLQGVPIRFVVANPEGATVTVDGDSSNSGFLDDFTGPDGCAVATITSSSVIAGQDDIEIVFSVGGLFDTLVIIAPGQSVLFAIPSSISAVADPVGPPIEPPLDPPGNQAITLRLLDGSGEGIEGVQLTGACSGGVALIANPGVTNFNGATFATILYVDSGDCVFTTPTGTPTANVSVTVVVPE